MTGIDSTGTHRTGIDDATLRSLAADVPLIDDRLLLEVVNGVTLARSFGARRQGFFARFGAALSGTAGTREAVHGVADGLAGTTAWLTELSRHATVTNLAVARAVRHCRDTRVALERTDEALGHVESGMRELAEFVVQAVDRLQHQVDEVERRLDRLELAAAAERSFGLVVDSWAAGERYATLPWICQVALLARETFSGPCGMLEHGTGDPTHRERLIHRILADRRGHEAIENVQPLRRVLEAGIEQAPDAERRLMAAELLDAGLVPQLALPAGRLTTTLTTTLELSALPPTSRPEHPALLALDLTRQRLGDLTGVTDRRTFVRQLVSEQAEAVLAYRRHVDASAARPPEGARRVLLDDGVTA